MKKTKILSALLAALLALTSAGSLASCRKAGAEPKKEKRTNVYYLVQAGSLPVAVKHIEEVMGTTAIDYTIASLAETMIMDVYEHKAAVAAEQ